MPVILERCISLDIGGFRLDWATPGRILTGNSRWFQNDEETSSIGYRIHTDPTRPLLFLFYSIDGQNVTQTVELAAVPSNLNRGQYWVFLCPVCGRRCKKLHLIRGLFQHRTAMPGVFYKQQARTKWAFGRLWDADDAIHEIRKASEAPYFREYYAGKLTRRTLGMLRKLRKLAPRVSEAEMQRLLKSEE
ncbi:MAG: hypothetical protein KA138_05035 [Saprospiraceae bacterium]|jgi:hypothetical protein|nr:hypothetical protein [Saprospiraceae bacterium]